MQNWPPLKKFETPIDQLFSSSVQRWPERDFLRADGLRLSYGETARQVDAVAQGLLSLGVVRGDRVALWMSNIWEWVVVQFAVTRIGAVLTPLNTRLRTADLSHALRDSGAKVLFIQETTHEFLYIDVANAMLAGEEIPSLRHVVVARATQERQHPYVSWPNLLERGIETHQSPAPETDPGQLAYILYTSGTTSLPKGVMLSHRNLNNCFNLVPDMQDEETMFLAYPLFAITGCHNSVLTVALRGGCLVLQENFDAVEANRLVGQHRCTSIAGIFPVLNSLVQAENFPANGYPSLKYAAVFPRRPEHLKVLRALGIERAGTGYGMTETCAMVTYVSDLSMANMTCDGFIKEDAELRLLKEGGAPALAGEDGEVQVRGPQVMLGYWNLPAATAQAVTADGWLKTGDVGRLDVDGRFTWVGRNSDIYKCSGFNVASLEVEAFLASMPAVHEVAVVGVPDPAKGEVGCACVVLKAGTSLSLAEVHAHCHGRIASYKIPGHLVTMQAFPKTVSGKVRKNELKAAFLQAHP